MLLKAIAIIASAFGVRLVNAALNALQWHPELWIMERIMDAPSEAWIEVMRWGIAFIIAGAGWATVYFYRRSNRDPSRPARDWLPISDAPFEFRKRHADKTMPHFLAGAEIKKKPNPPGMPFNPGHAAVRAKNGWDLIFVDVDWKERKFVWQWGDLSKNPPLKFGISAPPWGLNVDSCERFALNHLSNESWEYLKGKATFTWGRMTYPVMERITDGRLVVWARHGSPTAQFERVSADSWQHFRITDWSKGQAESDSGDHLYSVHVSLNRRKARAHKEKTNSGYLVVKIK